MSSHDDVDVRGGGSAIARSLSEWYSLNPVVRRLWAYEALEPDPNEHRPIDVIVALIPVCDSDDVSPIWLARYAGWKEQLQELLGRTVRLDWRDPNTGLASKSQGPDQERVGLATLAWRG